MTFQPIIPSGGLVGWRFLERTFEAQSNAFQQSAELKRDTDYFMAEIGKIDTAEQLVSDRRLLSVALGAFGLSEDINNRYFVQKILEEGILTDDSLANRMADERYKDLTKAFGFGDFDTPRTKLSDFGEEIVAQFHVQEFEVAVGQQNDDLRLALYAERELSSLASSSASENTKWLEVMGHPPLRRVFEAALGLPQSFGQVDLDVQLSTFKDLAQRQLGADIEDFADPEKVESLVQRFIARAQIAEAQAVSGSSIALSLLQNFSLPRAF